MAALALLVDVLIVALAALVAVVGVTGGGVYSIAGLRVSMRAIDNPLVALTVLVAVRYLLRRRAPFLLVPRWRLADVDEAAASALDRMVARLGPLDDVGAVRLVTALVATAVLVRLFNAWRDPGFYSGDDVEVQAMSLSALWHAGWPAWDLRNAAFPFVFVYPAHALASMAGVADPGGLVFVGRASIAIFSSMALWLVWRAGRAWRPDERAVALIAAALLWLNALHMSFGGSELPRPVATVFVLAAFLLLQRPVAWAAAAAGAALGIATALRFSEAMFVAAAAAHLLWRGERRAAMVVAVGATATAAGVLALADVVYWHEPFHSLRAAFDYTIVRRLSSRGYEPAIWYLARLAQWVNPVVMAAAAVWLVRRRDGIAWWIGVPLVMLSVLPHKEARYAIPLVPFVMLAAAAAVVDLARARSRPAWAAPLLVAGIVLGSVHDVAHWRLPRTNAEVRLATRLATALPDGVPIAVEQAWRMGGALYFRGHDTIDLDPGRLGEPDYFQSSVPSRAWVVLDSRRPHTAALADVLSARGYVGVADDPDAHYRVWRPSK